MVITARSVIVRKRVDHHAFPYNGDASDLEIMPLEWETVKRVCRGGFQHYVRAYFTAPQLGQSGRRFTFTIRICAERPS
jgi:hypothetical protein